MGVSIRHGLVIDLSGDRVNVPAQSIGSTLDVRPNHFTVIGIDPFIVEREHLALTEVRLEQHVASRAQAGRRAAPARRHCPAPDEWFRLPDHTGDPMNRLLAALPWL